MNDAASCQSAVCEMRKASSLGDLGAALAIVRQMVPTNPQSSEFWSLASSVMTSRGEWEDARQALRRARETGPETPVLLSAEALLASYEAHFDEAKALVDRALAVDDSDVWVLRTCAGICFVQGDNDAAINLGKRLLGLYPEDQSGVLLCITILFGMGQVDEARQVLADAETRFHDSPLMWYTRAKFLIRERRTADALDCLIRASDGLPGNPDVWARLSSALEWARRLDEAEAAAMRALELSPISASAMSTMANVCRRRGLSKEAATWESKAATAMPALRVQMKLREAVAAIRQERWQDCLTTADEVLSAPSAPSRLAASQMRARALVHLERYDEADDAVAALEAMGSDRCTVYELKAAALEGRGYFESAERVLREGLDAYPASGTLRSALMRVLHETRQAEAEKVLADETLDHLPQVPYEFSSLCTDFSKAGHAEAAHKICEAGLRMFPDTEELRLFMAVESLEKGDFKGATELARGLRGDMRGVATTLRRAARFMVVLRLVTRPLIFLARLIRRMKSGSKPTDMN